jgi:hypothetical protein
MLMWARKNGLSLPVPLPAYFECMKARPAVDLVEGDDASRPDKARNSA